MHNKGMGRTRIGSTEVYARSLSVAYDLDLAIWFLFATHLLVIMIIYAKLFSNSTMHYKVMCRTRPGFTEVYVQSLSADCDLDLSPSHMVFIRDTSSYHDDHLCQIIFKSHHVQLSYGPDTIIENNKHTHTHTHTDRVNSFRHFMARHKNMPNQSPPAPTASTVGTFRTTCIIQLIVRPSTNNYPKPSPDHDHSQMHKNWVTISQATLEEIFLKWTYGRWGFPIL